MTALAEVPLHSSTPLYAQIRQRLRDEILRGRYAPHARLPSESDLMKAYGVSRITVRQALAALESEQLIFKVQGKGAFVSKPRPSQVLTRLQGFGAAMAEQGYETWNSLLSVELLPASTAVAQALELPIGSEIARIRRIRRVDGEPISLDITHVSGELGRRLAKEDLERRDIFALLENEFGISLGFASLTLDAVGANGEIAEALGVAVGSPILHLERLVHDAQGRPLDYEHLYCRGDAFRYRLRVDRYAERAFSGGSARA